MPQMDKDCTVILEEKSEQKINTEKYAQPQQLGKC